MDVSVCVCVCIDVCVCVYVCVCIYVCIYIYMYWELDSKMTWKGDTPFRLLSVCCCELVFLSLGFLTLCNTLQNTQHRISLWTSWQPRHTATHCITLNTLQHTATHCNTLQHTATQDIPLNIPKKTKLYVEQTQREKDHCVSLRVWEKERHRRRGGEKEKERENMCVILCACLRKTEREKDHCVTVRTREKKRNRGRQRGRERGERERVCFCMHRSEKDGERKTERVKDRCVSVWTREKERNRGRQRGRERTSMLLYAQVWERQRKKDRESKGPLCECVNAWERKK